MQRHSMQCPHAIPWSRATRSMQRDTTAGEKDEAEREIGVAGGVRNGVWGLGSRVWGLRTQI
eukprot:894002-Rhodomonas_salina.3